MDEEERLKELAAYKVLDTPPEIVLDELADIASLVCDAPMAAITMISADRQWYKAKKGLVASETKREDSFCQHALNKPKEVLVVPNALKDPRFKENPDVLGKLNIRFYAGAPLETPKGHVLGTLCVIDTKPRRLTDNQIKILKSLAKKAMHYLNARKLIKDQRQEIASNSAKLLKLTDQVPGVIFQFKINKNGKMSSDFISKGIKKLNSSLNIEILKRKPLRILKIVHPHDCMEVKRSLVESYEKVADWEVEFRVANGSDKYEWILGRAQIEKQPDKSLIWYGTFQNITDHKEYERTMEQLSFDISHVLRKPVTTLLGLTSLFGEVKLKKSEFKEYVRHIHDVSEELENFTTKLNETYKQNL